MHYPEIDFSRIRSAGAEGQRSGFEQFVCELAAEDPPQDGAVFVSLAGAGGDGGVECFWTLADGTEVGWQAKYWTRREDVDKAQLDDSVRTVLEQHPQLVEYLIAIPVDPTGRRKGKGKSLHEKVYDPGGWLSGWQSAASQRGMQVTFRVEWATNLITRFRNIDVSGARTRYWFDAEILADQWWQDRLEEAVQAARPRYLPALNVQVPTTQALAAVCGDPDVAVALESDISSLRHLTGNVRRDPLGAGTAGAPVAVDFDPARQSLAQLIDALTRWKDDPSLDAAARLRGALAIAQQQVASAEEAETAALDAQFGPGWDTPSWRQVQAEYMVSLPATAVDALRRLEDVLTELASRVHALVDLRSAHAVLLTSEAGQGKTFVTLDTVQRRLDRGLLGVFLHGRPFHQGDILQQVRERLGLPQDLSGDDVLSLLDQAGRSSGNPVLVVVDALNESRPRTVWQDQLDTLITKINRYAHLRAVFTVRSHYRSQVLPEGLELTEIVHHGFAGVEHDALQEYADYFHLVPPAAPPVQTEFSSPLFLRLLCEALDRQGRRSLNEASLGLDALATLLLGQINRRISMQLGALEADQIVYQAMDSFAQALSSAGQPWLDRPQVNTLMRSIWPDRQAETSLLDALVGEGLLAEDTDSEATGLQRHVVAMAFERLGQHLVVSAATRALTTTADVRQALASGSLRDLLGLNTLVDPGLLEALSVILGDRGMELTDFADEVGDDQSVTAVVAGLAWRAQSSITSRTAQAVRDSLATPAFPETLDMLFRLAPRPDHPLNAEFLHRSLAGRSMADVDSLLTPWLHHTRDTGGAAHRLISWALHADVTRTTPHTSRLWVTALLWCTGCSDRRVRDDATMAAARLLIQHPEQIPAVLQQITDADDDWILERACYAAYTALLRAGSAAAWNGATHAVWEMVFAPAPRANAVLRDVARSVISRAQEHGALADGIDIGRTRPPYDTPWPITWPAAADIQLYKDASAHYPKLHFSCTADDFFTYVITPAVRDYPDLDPAAVARRVVTDVIGLGYDPALHADFDHDVLDRYGGGRSKPKWIERIGKKYQWIAFARLLGRIGDHVPRQRGRWDPPEPATPGPEASRLHQMDPTMCDARPDKAAPPRFHVPAYDWAGFSRAASPADWIAEDGDLPEVPVLITSEDTPRTILSGNYEWRLDAEPKNDRPSLWVHMMSRFVRTADLPALREELDGTDLTDIIARISGAMFADGFVGEYPFGQHFADVDEVVHVLQGRRAGLSHGASSFLDADEAEVVRLAHRDIQCEAQVGLVLGVEAVVPVDEQGLDVAGDLLGPQSGRGGEQRFGAGHGLEARRMRPALQRPHRLPVAVGKGQDAALVRPHRARPRQLSGGYGGESDGVPAGRVGQHPAGRLDHVLCGVRLDAAGEPVLEVLQTHLSFGPPHRGPTAAAPVVARGAPLEVGPALRVGVEDVLVQFVPGLALLLQHPCVVLGLRARQQVAGDIGRDLEPGRGVPGHVLLKGCGDPQQALAVFVRHGVGHPGRLPAYFPGRVQEFELRAGGERGRRQPPQVAGSTVSQEGKQAVQELVRERLGHRDGGHHRVGQHPALVVPERTLVLPRQ